MLVISTGQQEKTKEDEGTLATNLSQPQRLCVPHLLYIPEEGLLTLLTGVTFQPLGSLRAEHSSDMNTEF